MYVGSTDNIPSRLWEHRTKRKPRAFTARYNVFKPVYYEPFDDINDAVKREWFIKGKTRKWKEALIATMNPEWMDLTEEITRKYS